MIAASLIDTTALGKIILASLIGGVGVVVAFGLILLGLSKGSRAKADGRRLEQTGYYVVTALCGLLCVAAVAFGIYAMINKPTGPAPTPAAARSAALPAPPCRPRCDPAGYQVPARETTFWQPPVLLALATVQVRESTPDVLVILNLLPVGTDVVSTT